MEMIKVVGRYLNVILNGYNFAYNIIKIKPRGVLAIDQ